MDEHESPVYFLCNHVGIAGKVGLAAKTLMEACMIRAKVRDWIKHHDLLPWGGNVLAACSGGADSLVSGWIAGRMQLLSGWLDAEIKRFLDTTPPWR